LDDAKGPSRQGPNNTRPRGLQARLGLAVRNVLLLQSSRARLRLALLVCLSAAAVLGFVLFPPRRVTIGADGNEKVVVSRTNDLDTLLRMAGFRREANDVVVRTGTEYRIERAVPVTVHVDGKVITWRTRADTVQALLDEVGVQVSPYDGIVYNGVEVNPQEPLAPGPLAAVTAANIGAQSLSPPSSIDVVINRAVPFTIVEDGRRIAFKSARPTVAMALRDAGIRLGPADDVYPPLSTPLVAGQEVVVDHAAAVTVRIGNSSQVIYTHQKLLKNALAEAGLDLGPDDRVEPSVDSDVFNGMTARLVRVTGRSIVEREDVPRRTVFKPDDSLQGSQTRIVQGHDGVHLTEYRIVIEDGVETERTLVRDWYEPEVVDNVIYYAASSLRATGLQPDSFQVLKVEHVYATWYNAASSGRPNTDPHYGITATGVPVTKGIVAVDPNVIPLGTRLYIPGYGFAVAGDTGGGIVGAMIDLGYPDGVAPDGPTGWIDVYLLAP
jgi:uncharacterized protein YabE (DUF348 family)/3D (Asp-Asp-Asp) domain-containing protein